MISSESGRSFYFKSLADWLQISSEKLTKSFRIKFSHNISFCLIKHGFCNIKVMTPLESGRIDLTAWNTIWHNSITGLQYGKSNMVSLKAKTFNFPNLGRLVTIFWEYAQETIITQNKSNSKAFYLQSLTEWLKLSSNKLRKSPGIKFNRNLSLCIIKHGFCNT